MDKRIKLSIVVSVFNEEEALPLFYETAMKVLLAVDWDYEFLFINDGRTDMSRAELNRIAQDDPLEKGIHIFR